MLTRSQKKQKDRRGPEPALKEYSRTHKHQAGKECAHYFAHEDLKAIAWNGSEDEWKEWDRNNPNVRAYESLRDKYVDHEDNFRFVAHHSNTYDLKARKAGKVDGLHRRIEWAFHETLKQGKRVNSEKSISQEKYEDRWRQKVRALKDSGGIHEPVIYKAMKSIGLSFGFDLRFLNGVGPTSMELPESEAADDDIAAPVEQTVGDMARDFFSGGWIARGFKPPEPEELERQRKAGFGELFALAEEEEQARLKAEETARLEAEERARSKAEERLNQRPWRPWRQRREVVEAKGQKATVAAKAREERARSEGVERARREAEERTRREGQQRAQREAEERARREGQQRAQREAEERRRREAEERARREAEHYSGNLSSSSSGVRVNAGGRPIHENGRFMSYADARARGWGG